MWILCRTFERGSGLSAVHVGPKNNTPRHKRGSTAAAPGQIFKVGGSVLLLGFLALPRSFLTVIKHFSFQIFFLLLEMARRDCSLQLPAVLMCYNKNNATPLTASLVRLLSTLEN